MIWLWPLGLQAILMLIDESYFHRRRGLPAWEKWGHPLDTFCFLICVVWAAYADLGVHSDRVYLALSVVSCLMITKDEIMHSEVCSKAESWVHSLLFILHPVVLAGIWFLRSSNLKEFIFIELAAVSVVFIFQVGYWNFLR